jgi:preprotein translocase subunit SecG
MIIQFWSNDPSILFNKDYIFELWPMSNMSYEQKMNAVSRLIILITILGYILTRSTRILAVGFLTLAIIFVLFKMRKQKITKEILNEGFTNENTGMFDNKPKSKNINSTSLHEVLKTDFQNGNKKNPFSNVLLTQIMDEPDRKSAPPAFNLDVESDITKNVKRSVQMMNSGIKNTNKQLYDSLWDKFNLDQSNRVFYSTPNTRVEPGNQSAFGQWLYGTMPSAKESTPEGNMQRYKDQYRYTLY